jgi:hypothetical protein
MPEQLLCKGMQAFVDLMKACSLVGCGGFSLSPARG